MAWPFQDATFSETPKCSLSQILSNNGLRVLGLFFALLSRRQISSVKLLWFFFFFTAVYKQVQFLARVPQSPHLPDY